MSEVFRDFVAGSVGGFAAKIFDYPLDSVKTLLQTQTTAGIRAEQQSVHRYSGAWDCLIYTVRTKGVTSLYKGISSPLLGSVAENAVLFWAYNHCRIFLGETPHGPDLSLLQLSTAGAGAGAVVSFVLTPVELVKCRLQVQNSASGAKFRVFRGPLDVIIQTLKYEGITRGMYRGHLSTMCREIPGNFCFFGVYEMTCKAMIPPGGSKKDLGASAHILGGILSGVAYWTAFFPADTIKCLQQTHPDYAQLNFRGAFMKVMRTQGIGGLYQGLGVTLAKSAPSTALIFACYEWTMKALSS